MPSIVEALDRLNRKERFWLLSDAVGRDVPDNVKQRMPLSQTFTGKLQKELCSGNAKVAIPGDAWWAFDYHLDWLFAVLHFFPDFNFGFDWQANPVSPDDYRDQYIRGSQQDCDLIIAFDYSIILVEAKVSESWSNPQLIQKMRRLKRLRIPDGLELYFVLASPRSPKNVKFDEWPEWALKSRNRLEPYWINLTLPEESKDWLKVIREGPEGQRWRLCEAGQ